MRACSRRVRQIIADPRVRSLALSSPLRATLTLGTLAAAVGGVFLISGAARPPSARAAASVTKPAEGPISGRVLTPEGKPVQGAKVLWTTRVDRDVPVRASILTDADGRYHLSQLHPGSYNVALGLDNEVAESWTAPAHERLVIGQGEQQDGIDFTLIRGAVLTGKAIALGQRRAGPGLWYRRL